MMRRFLLMGIAFVAFIGCGNQSTATNDTKNNTASPTFYTGESYISTIAGDTVPVSNLAHAPKVPPVLPMLVILLEYDNQKIISSDTAWAQKIFGYNDGELNSYYGEISNDQFLFVPANESSGTKDDGIIKVHLQKNHPNTDIDSSSFYANLTQDLQEALSKADSFVDFSSYDTNADGAIQPTELAVIFVIAGYEDAFAGYHIPNGIWAHQSSLRHSDAPLLDGVTLFDETKHGKYAVFGERHGNSTNSYDATIGIIAHELGHAIFNLPDLYNINDEAGGIGIFGLMGAGVWTRKNDSEYYGKTPTHMSAWSKMFIGWVQPRELHNTTAILNETTSSSYNVIKIPISANHYYLLENRNDSGYDRGLRELEGTFKGGMLIWHINQKRLTTNYFATNTVNAETDDKGVDVVEANDPVLDSDPGSLGNAKALFYDPNRTNFGSKLTNISEPGSVMNLNIH